MAEWYGGNSDYSYYWGTSTTQAYLSAYVEIISEYTARVHVHTSTACINGGMSEYGVHTQCGVESYSADGKGIYSGNGNWVGQVEGSWDFSRGASDYNVTVFGKYWGDTVNGYGPAGNSGEVYGTLTIPARPYYPAGAPSANVSKTQVPIGMAITLSWTKSSTQGNANFDHFEVTDGLGARLYVGSGTSIQTVPSKILDQYGKDNYYKRILEANKNFKKGWVYYAVWEVHEWYGSYPSSPICWIGVEVKSGVITVYDSAGKKHVGLVTAYDASGKPHFVLISAYDSSGKRHDTQ